MLDNVGLRYSHRASGVKAPRTLRPLPLLRFAASATGGAHLCSIQYYLCFWLGICRTPLAVSALRIMRYCLINFDASSLPAFSPILRLFIWDILADSAIMVKSGRLCRTEPAIFKEDIIMSKIVNEAKIGHLRSGLLLLLPDIHCLHRRRFSAWPSRLSCSEDAAG